MDPAQDLQKKARNKTQQQIGSAGSSSGSVRTDVFDQLGNDGLRATVEEQRQVVAPEEEPPSLLAALDAAAPEQQVAPAIAEEKPEQAALAAVVAPPEEAKKPEVVEEIAPVVQPEVAEQIAEQAKEGEIDPVLLVDPKDVGNSEVEKEELLGEDGQELIGKKVEASLTEVGAAKLDSTGLGLISDRLLSELDSKDIVEAKQEGKLEQLVDHAIRQSALRSRDEVIFLLQQLMSDEGELKTILTSSDPGTIAIQMIEYLSVMLVDFSDLYALAAYDHHEITQKIVITDDALNMQRMLSPLALKMGGFSTVLYQLVVNELAVHPLASNTPATAAQDGSLAAEDPMTNAPKFRQNLFSLVNQLRLYRTQAA